MILMVSSGIRHTSIKFSLVLYLSVLSLVGLKLKTNFILSKNMDSWYNTDFKITLKYCWSWQPNIHTNKDSALWILTQTQVVKQFQLPRCLKEKASDFQGKTNLDFKNTVWSLVIKVQKIGANSEYDWRYWYFKAISGETDLGTSNWEECRFLSLLRASSVSAPSAPGPLCTSSSSLCLCDPLVLFIYVYTGDSLKRQPTIGHSLIFPW